MCFDIIKVCVSLLEYSLAFEIDPQVLLDSVEIDVSLNVIQNELIFSAEKQLNDLALSRKLSLQLTVIIQIPNTQ